MSTAPWRKKINQGEFPHGWFFWGDVDFGLSLLGLYNIYIYTCVFFKEVRIWASECFNKRGHREYRVYTYIYIYAHFHFYLPTHLISTSVFYIFLCKCIYHNSQKSIFRVQPRSPSVLLMFISTWAGKDFPIQFCTFHEKNMSTDTLLYWMYDLWIKAIHIHAYICVCWCLSIIHVTIQCVCIRCTYCT